MKQSEQIAIESIPVAQIVPSQFNARKSFDTERLAVLKHSIVNFGLQNPISVRLLPKCSDGQEKYEILHGERRWRAFKELGILAIDAVVWDLGEISDAEAAELSLVENLIREDLNPIEEIEGIIMVLGLHLQIPENSVIRLLYQFNNQISRDNEGQFNGNVAIKVEGKGKLKFELSEVQSVLDRISGASKKISIVTLVSHKLPLLRLPPELDKAVRQGLLEASKVLQLRRVKNDLQRAKLLQEVCKKDLSVREIISRIKQLKGNTNENAQAVLASLNASAGALEENRGSISVVSDAQTSVAVVAPGNEAVAKSGDSQEASKQVSTVPPDDDSLLDKPIQLTLRLFDSFERVQTTVQRAREGIYSRRVAISPERAEQLESLAKEGEKMQQKLEELLSNIYAICNLC